MYSFVSAYFNDIYYISHDNLLWTEISSVTLGTPPSPRSSFGFASAGGKFYLYGGFGFSGVPLSLERNLNFYNRLLHIAV
jgi:hypothetical protein